MKQTHAVRLTCIAMCVFLLFSATTKAQVVFEFTSPIEKTDFSTMLIDFLKWILGVAGSIDLIALILAGISYIT